MSRHTIIALILLLLAGCSSAPVTCGPDGNCDGQEDETMPIKIASFTTEVFRTTEVGNQLGIPPGNPLPSINQDNLEPGEYTIQFEAQPPSDGAGFSAYAIVTWKILGQQLTRKVGVFSGTAISGVAEAVDVKIVDVSGEGTLLPVSPVPVPYKIACTLSRGTRATTMQPPTLVSQPVGVVIPTPGGSTEWIIPKNAGIMSAMLFVRSTVAFAPFAFSAFVRTASFQTVTSYNVSPDNPVWIPIAPSAEAIIILNDSAGDATANIVWGVEG